VVQITGRRQCSESTQQ